MLHWNRNFVSIADFYFGEALQPVEADVLRLRGWPAPVEGAVRRETHTVVVDLAHPQEQLLAAMKKRNRNRIRRAETKDGLVYESFQGASVFDKLDGFMELCEGFTSWKGHYHSDGGWMHELARQQLLSLSFTRLPEIEGDAGTLTWESHLVGSERVVCLSAGTIDRRRLDSVDTALVGRATRFNVWRDMLRFRAAGVQVFDFGGYHPDRADSKKAEIDDYKLSFGGRVEKQFEIARGLTMKGRLAVFAKSRLSEEFP